VEFDVTGEVFFVNEFFDSIVSVGSPLAGRLTYDTAAADTNADPTIGTYPGATMEFTMGSYAYAGEGWIYVYDTPTFDEFQFQGMTGGADPIDGLPLQQVTFSFVGTTALYTSDALPVAPPALDDPALFEPPAARLGVIPEGSGTTYQYARLLTVPEPEGSLAGLAAAVALAGVRGRARPRG
jgi:hypothetical protein